MTFYDFFNGLCMRVCLVVSVCLLVLLCALCYLNGEIKIYINCVYKFLL